MTNEERILERLERMEEQITFLHERAQGTKELIEDLTPISNHAFRLMVAELEDINGVVSLEDLLELLGRALRSTPNLSYCLDQLENLIDLWRTIHPAIAPTWPHVIGKLGQWEQEGVFAKAGAMKDVGGKLLDANSPEDIARIGDSLVFLMALLQKLSDPNVQVFLSRAVDMLGSVDLDNAKPVGMFGMVGALGAKETKEGLGVALQVLKALGKLSGTSAPSCDCGCNKA